MKPEFSWWFWCKRYDGRALLLFSQRMLHRLGIIKKKQINTPKQKETWMNYTSKRCVPIFSKTHQREKMYFESGQHLCRFDKWQFSQQMKSFLQMFLSEILLISNGFQRVISILENHKKLMSPKLAGQIINTQLNYLWINVAEQRQICWSNVRETNRGVIFTC